MQTRTFNGQQGLRLAADVGGDPGHQPVVFLHGGGQTRHSWGRAARETIALGYYVISLDLRGHGESEWSPEGRYEIDDYVADLKAVIAELPAPPALVGASLGGITAMVTAGESDHPLVAALVLVDIVPRMDMEGVARIRNFMEANPDGFVSLEAAADAVAEYLPERPRPPSPEGLGKNLRRREDGRYYWHWDPRMHGTFGGESGPEGFDGVLRMQQRMEAAARGVTVPTLLVRGAASAVVSTEGARHLMELIPHAEFVDVGGAGHMVAGDDNDQFNAAVEAFLQRVVQV